VLGAALGRRLRGLLKTASDGYDLRLAFALRHPAPRSTWRLRYEVEADEAFSTSPAWQPRRGDAMAVGIGLAAAELVAGGDRRVAVVMPTERAGNPPPSPRVAADRPGTHNESHY
jgi:hypothetical protein